MAKPLPELAVSPPGRQCARMSPAPRGHRAYKSFFGALPDKREWLKDGDCIAGFRRLVAAIGAGCRRRADEAVRCGLTASDLACVRGGREVFAGARILRSAAARRCWSPGRTAPGKSSLLRMIAGLLRLAGGRLALAGGDAERTHRRAGALPRPSGRAEAVADGRREPAVSGPRYLGAASDSADARRWPRSGSTALADLPAGLPLGRPAAAAVDRPAARRAAADLAARRADRGARPRGAGHARRADARSTSPAAG